MSVEPLSKQFLTVSGKQMAYHDVGEGDPVVFLHGNPTSSYLWRDIVPHVSGQARCVVPDLIGQGDSDKLDDPTADSYTFVEHRDYLDGLLDQLDLGDNITFVIHDWGSALGFDWANRNRDRVAGICYMEAIVRPVTWDEWPESARGIFQSMRTEAGEEIVMTKNLFIEAILPSSIMRTLSDEEMNEYRRPFVDPADRRPTLTWPRRSPSTASPPTCTTSFRPTPTGYRRLTSQSCSSMPTRALSSPDRNASSAVRGPTKLRSPFPASTSSKKTARTKSARPSPTG